MERLTESHGVEVVWHSFELRPAGSPPMPAEYRARIEASRPRLMAIAKEQYGLTLNQGPFGIDSRPALTVAKWAEQEGVGPAYHAAVMRAYWEAGQDISELGVLEEVVAAVGLPADEVARVIGDAEWVAEVDADIQLARHLGLNSVPALVFDQKYLVSGAQPYAALVEAVEKIRTEPEN